MLQAAYIIGIAIGLLIGLIVGVALTALISINIDEADTAAAYYYGILEGKRNAERDTSQIQGVGEGQTE